MQYPKDPIEKYFAFARERHSVYLKKQAGLPRPWTTDPILNHYKFTNVFRELDKTTAWFRENVRDPLKNRPEVLLATVVFRMFNRIEIGEELFKNSYGFDEFLDGGRAECLETPLRAAFPKGPWCTGAYLITSPKGYDKLAGVCQILQNFYKTVYLRMINDTIIKQPHPFSLEQMWNILKQVPYLGTFHSYEIVTDLRHTAYCFAAPDVNTWAHAGPGAQRGLARLHGRDYKKKVSDNQAIREMYDLLLLSRKEKYWPQEWPKWELREVEMHGCEWDKRERIELGQGHTRSIYKQLNGAA